LPPEKPAHGRSVRLPPHSFFFLGQLSNHRASMDRRTYALLLAYDGSPFRGWQRQPPLPTVQGAVEAALAQTLGRPLDLFGAGRTDAGVHAEAQVAHFHARLPVELDALRDGLRANLPATIRLLAAAAASDSFHARSSSVGKRYRYRFSWGARDESSRTFWLGARAEPRWERAREALAELAKLPHLSGLASPSKGAKPAPPLESWTLDADDAATVGIAGGVATLELKAKAFRKHEVRNLAGHLAAIALGLAEPSSLSVLARMQRPWRGATAPPHGLTLLEVLYPADLDPFRSTAEGQNGAEAALDRANTSAAISR